MSLYRWRGLSSNRTFVGFDNYQKLAADHLFWQCVKNNLWLLVVGGTALIALGLLLAHGMQTRGALTRFLRSIYLFPQVVSLVVVAILWMFLYNPTHGLVPDLVRRIGIQPPAEGFLGSSILALPAVCAAFVWYALGFYVMLFSAGVQQIPIEVSEAAELDGATGPRRFFGITWPLLWAVRRVACVYVVINVMNVFALVYLMTRGGPDRHTDTMLTYLYEQAFVDRQFGYAASLAVVNLVIALLLSAFVMLLLRRNPTAAKT
jgi:N-acetylglucosamine transport system permease protein